MKPRDLGARVVGYHWWHPEQWPHRWNAQRAPEQCLLCGRTTRVRAGWEILQGRRWFAICSYCASPLRFRGVPTRYRQEDAT